MDGRKAPTSYMEPVRGRVQLTAPGLYLCDDRMSL